VALAAAAPVSGRLIDRYGVRIPLIVTGTIQRPRRSVLAGADWRELLVRIESHLQRQAASTDHA